jgi:hypothetical protein
MMIELCGGQCPVKQEKSCFMNQFPVGEDGSICLTGDFESPLT